MTAAFVAAAGLFVLAASPRAQAPAAPKPAASAARGGTLGALAADLAAGRLTVIDLTQTLNAATPIIQLPPPFANTPGFKSHAISAYDAKGPAWYWNWIEVGEHVGTHFDAPCHWVTGKDKPCVDQIAANRFIGPAAVIDVTADVAKNADFVATKETILAWEKKHGRLPKNAWVILRTGWGARATDAKRFLNVGADGAPHYPGFGKDSAEFLTKERDILGVGVEQVGTDAAVGSKATPPFPNHSIMHGSGHYGLTQLANVDKLPESGAIVIATPLKIERGSGSPVRVIAIAPAR
ncbi:MAG TPA: cyclase family protein [Vicinamibacterales bacterium]|jgi:kynurenine formamidase|nr:cyclase family protein [Vicinamibacterales bacterium]